MTQPASRRPQYAGDPTLASVMRRPKWIGALVLALIVAAVFAWLGQWQLGHAVRIEQESTAGTEIPRQLGDATEAGAAVSDGVAGSVLTTRGALIPGDFEVVEERTNQGEHGAWVVGHAAVDGGHAAIALGWAPSAADAVEAISRIEESNGAWFAEVPIEARYMPADAPVVPGSDDDPQRIASMAPAQLANRWAPFDGAAYAGYFVLHPQSAGGLSAAELADVGLDPIDSVPPLPVEQINWLNVFYAVEWVVFAGFAVFFWYRLARDDWERIHELQLLADSEARAD